jgi:hypothetical protein
MSKQINVQTTGLRGFFQWILQDQPVIGTKLVQLMSQQVPQAFSDYDGAQAMGRLRGLADDTTDITGDFDSTDPLDLSSGVSYTPVAATTSIGGTDFSSASTIASTANTGATDPSLTAATATGLQSIMTAMGVPASTAATILGTANQQLTNAQAGLPPTSATTAAAGVPQQGTISSALGGTTGILIIGGVLLLAGLLLSSGKGGGGGSGAGPGGFVVVK